MKNIGKPCAGKLHARFDEGGQVKLTMVRLVRHRQTKGAVNGYAKPTAQGNLFSTLPIGSLWRRNRSHVRRTRRGRNGEIPQKPAGESRLMQATLDVAVAYRSLQTTSLRNATIHDQRRISRAMPELLKKPAVVTVWPDA